VPGFSSQFVHAGHAAAAKTVAGIGGHAGSIHALWRYGSDLALGHRTSVDFDFFSNAAFDPERLASTLPYLKNAERVQMGAGHAHLSRGPRWRRCWCRFSAGSAWTSGGRE